MANSSKYFSRRLGGYEKVVMKKEKMLEIYDELIKEETKSLEEIAKTIGKLAKSPRLVTGLTEIVNRKRDIVEGLNWMRIDVENHGKDMRPVDAVFGVKGLDDGIVIDEEE